MNSLDTSVVLRYLLNDTPDQAEQIGQVISKSACYITDVVAVELIFVLDRVIKLDRQGAVRLVKAFLSLHNMVYNDYFLDQVIDMYQNHKQLSIVDCYAACESRMYNNTLLSFDKDLVRLGGKHVKLLGP